jgi:hypothetical protein
MRIKKGITIPYEYTLRKADGVAIDLTNATTVKMVMIKDGEDVPTINGACGISSPPTSGKVTYSWNASQTSTTGFYWLKFIITWNNGKLEEVPSNGYDYIVIL